MAKPVLSMTERELVEFGTPATNEALQAEKEMMRRLKDSAAHLLFATGSSSCSQA